MGEADEAGRKGRGGGREPEREGMDRVREVAKEGEGEKERWEGEIG